MQYSFIFYVSVLLHSSLAQNIGIYWGQNSEEGTLNETCATGKYSYVIIASLRTFNNYETPEINLGGHCNPDSNECASISYDIKTCQKQGIKVLLSVTRVDRFIPRQGLYSNSTKFSYYLWNNFLGGNSSSRPLGDAVLDGIDFVIQNDYYSYWVDVAHHLKFLSPKHVYLSAAPLCSFDNSENSTLNNGLFNRLSVQFADSPKCEYKEGNVHHLINSWNQWTKLKVKKISLGLPPSMDAGSGYIPANLLNSEILSVTKKSQKYGGILLSSRYYDKVSGYSDSIISSICTKKHLIQCSGHDINFTEDFGYMSKASFMINDSKVIRRPCCEAICRNDCSCVAYAPANYTTDIGCQIWSKNSTFTRSSPGSNGQKIYVAVKWTQEPDGRIKHSSVTLKRIWITIAVLALAITFICYLSYAFWRKYKAEDSKKKYQNLLKANTNDGVEIFGFESMAAATNNFSASNKIGEGGFGPVYLGRLTDNREIAIKRLSSNSGQGLIEFKNEAQLIAKLQHTNLVKLLGLCIEREERILVYEYMSNRSLYFHLFERKDVVLDWEKRLSIIEGIAQGILYLHKYSRVTVIHRDLKASNILLDDKMNPKISDFGMARILGLKGSEEKTNRVVGTYGYMSPEYALKGFISVKVDVFSFGVLMLEILSGKKNNYCHHSNLQLNLIGHAWKLWNEGRALEIMDTRLNEISCNSREVVIRCMHIGLLCVQDHATDRPTMFEVVTFLSNHSINLPQPKQPAFFINVDRCKSELPSHKQEKYSINYVTLSAVDGR